MPSDSNRPLIYLDACVLIDLIETPIDKEPAKTIASILADAEKGQCDLITSSVTIAEAWCAKAEIERKEPSPEVEKLVSRLWNPAASPIHLIDVHELISREAAKILRGGIVRGWSKTKGVDGIHLATAKREGVDELFTTDKSMFKWADVLGFKICEPHCLEKNAQLELPQMPEPERQ